MAEHRKRTKGKPRPTMVPMGALMKVSEVMTASAEKYGDLDVPVPNYRSCPDPIVYVDAAFRHLMKHVRNYRSGKGHFSVDEETGLHHLAHAAASCLIALELIMEGVHEQECSEGIHRDFGGRDTS